MERQLSRVIMGEGKPKVRKLKEGATLTKQGEEADAIYLLLDGVIQVDVDGEEIANLGPGALIGERAVLEGGSGTATLLAVTPCKVAEARKVELDLDKLAEVSEGHRREEQPAREGPRARRPGLHPGSRARLRRHGGNTSCLALAHDGAAPSLVLDAGTGLRGLGALLGERPFRGALLLGHLHWDHTQGLPFSPPVDNDGAEVRLCLPDQDDGDTAIDVLRRAMSPPHFPIGPEALRGAWTFEGLEPGEHHARRLRGAGPRDPPQGRAHLRLPGQRRAARRSPTCPTTVRRRWGRARTAGGRTTTPPWRWPPASTC